MQCAYCGKPATRIDLCHQLVPVCDAHHGTGHQLGALPPTYKPTGPVKAKP